MDQKPPRANPLSDTATAGFSTAYEPANAVTKPTINAPPMVKARSKPTFLPKNALATPKPNITAPASSPKIGFHSPGLRGAVCNDCADWSLGLVKSVYMVLGAVGSLLFINLATTT